MVVDIHPTLLIQPVGHCNVEVARKALFSVSRKQLKGHMLCALLRDLPATTIKPYNATV
ncbi:Uncharacterised protein [Vibrio cholerae]|nr:Uncharacterised protein [Vibrio cholerae]CSD87624.1 Uncharacterised protein [Vibrio cholerae]